MFSTNGGGEKLDGTVSGDPLLARAKIACDQHRCNQDDFHGIHSYSGAPASAHCSIRAMSHVWKLPLGGITSASSDSLVDAVNDVARKNRINGRWVVVQGQARLGVLSPVTARALGIENRGDACIVRCGPVAARLFGVVTAT